MSACGAGLGKQLFACLLKGPSSFTYVSLGRHSFKEKVVVIVDVPVSADILY